MDSKEIRKVLKFDALHEAEKVSGKSYKEDKLTEALGFLGHLSNVTKKRELLESIGDSTFSNTEENYLEIVKSIGFESVLIDPFVNSDGIEERFHIMWHKEYSILLKFDTHTWGDDGSWAKSGDEVPPPSVNGGNFYYHWSPKPDYDFSCTSSGGFVGNGDSNRTYFSYFNRDFTPHILPEELRSIEPKMGDRPYSEFNVEFEKWKLIVDTYIESKDLIKIYSGNHDCREAIKFNISELLKNGTFVKKWKEQPFLWLLGYMDSKVEGYDYKKITEERLNRLPKFVLDCIR
tara:strand:- start:9388 stop:10257 length:870 start_codon:yes stop_codon:yes gene_type:complete